MRVDYLSLTLVYNIHNHSLTVTVGGYFIQYSCTHSP